MFEALLRPGQIGNLSIKNRIVQAPMFSAFGAPDGTVTTRTLRYYRERAKGGTGLIIVEYTYIDDYASKSNICQLGIHSEECIPGLARLAETIKYHGARAGIQLEHCGRQKFLGTYPMVAPSRVPWEESLQAGGVIPEELTIEQIQQIVRDFGEAARRAKEAGFDLVEIHAAHGYLLTGFLSSDANRRTDMYGGSLQDRMRFPLEVVKVVRAKVGRNFPLSVRISADEYTPGGVTLDESKEFARQLEKVGVDVVHVSAGNHSTMDTQISSMYGPAAPNADAAAAIKRCVSIPVIASGSINTPSLAEEILSAGKADFVSLARPLVADSHFALKVREGRPEDITPCIRCNDGCLVRGVVMKRALQCSVNFLAGKEDDYGTALEPAVVSKRVFVVGGRPAGMEAARVAALRGHKVTLYEKRGRLGGQLLEASVPEFKKDLRHLIDYLSVQLFKLNVELRRREATVVEIAEERPDAIIIATGSLTLRPDVPGVNGPNVLDGLAVLSGATVGKEVVVVGGGMIGSEVALFLAEQGKKVHIVEMLDDIAADLDLPARIVLLRRFRELGVQQHLGYRLVKVATRGVVAINNDLQTLALKADTVVVATGSIAETGLAKPLRELGLEVHEAGDCVAPRRIFDAIHEGHLAGRRV